MNNNLRVTDYFLAKLVGFNSGAMFASKYKSVKQVKDPNNIEGAPPPKEDNPPLIEGYVSNLPNVSIKNDFGSDLLGQAASKTFGGNSAMASGFAMFANSQGVVPQVSYSKKLAYRGVTMDDISVEFNLFLENDVVKDIFKPITDLLYNALPLRFGDDDLSARNVSGEIGKKMNDMAEEELKKGS